MAKNILLITDAWEPQTNGVVTTLTNLVDQAEQAGDSITVFHPGLCRWRFPLPGYTEIEIGLVSGKRARQLILSKDWDLIHIATVEGTLGSQFSKQCRKLNKTFTASCHTKFPEFVSSRLPFVPTWLGWVWMRHKYKGAAHILTTTDSMVQELVDQGFTQSISSWSRGVDRKLFTPNTHKHKRLKPLLLCVSRVSHEKGLDDFCSLDSTKYDLVLVGDGPYKSTLEKRYPHVEFAGKKTGRDLVEYYQEADVFVFPSRADTFGVVIIEALAVGTPVAAYPVTGPKDIIEQGKSGYLAESLEKSIDKCLDLDRKTVYNTSVHWTWETCYSQFKQLLAE